MTRTRSSAKSAGTRFESLCRDGLNRLLGSTTIERRAKNGAKDRGDLSGVYIGGEPCVVECKDYGGELRLPQWLKEAEVERGNADAEYGVVIAKRRGTSKFEDQYVVMTGETFAAIVAGGHEFLERGM